MYQRASYAVLGLAVLLAAACGDGGGSNNQETTDDLVDAALTAFFPPEHADALAHAAMPAPDDLPGPGWEVTARDEFDDEDGDEEDEFDRAFENEPACAPLRDLVALGGLFGEDEDELPPGRAQIEFENVRSRGPLSNSVEVSVEIGQTISEVQAGWDILKGLFDSGQMRDCMVAAMNAGALELAADRGTIDITGRDVSARTPHDGVAVGFDMHMEAGAVTLDLGFETYLWLYGNAAVTVVVTGSKEDVNLGLTGPVLGVVDDKVEAAAAIAAAGETAPEAHRQP